MGRRGVLHALLPADILAAASDHRLARSPGACTAVARAEALVAQVANERTALGHKPRTVLAAPESLEQELTDLVDRVAVTGKTGYHDQNNGGPAIRAYTRCSGSISS